MFELKSRAGQKDRVPKEVDRQVGGRWVRDPVRAAHIVCDAGVWTVYEDGDEVPEKYLLGAPK